MLAAEAVVLITAALWELAVPGAVEMQARAVVETGILEQLIPVVEAAADQAM
jgi:hypothetical protein